MAVLQMICGSGEELSQMEEKEILALCGDKRRFNCEKACRNDSNA